MRSSVSFEPARPRLIKRAAVVAVALLGCDSTPSPSTQEFQTAVLQHIAETDLAASGTSPICLKVGRWEADAFPAVDSLIPASGELVEFAGTALPQVRTGRDCEPEDRVVAISHPDVTGSSARVGWLLWLPEFGGGATESCWVEESDGDVRVRECRVVIEV